MTCDNLTMNCSSGSSASLPIRNILRSEMSTGGFSSCEYTFHAEVCQYLHKTLVLSQTEIACIALYFENIIVVVQVYLLLYVLG